jgi:hypothetical protein
MKWFVMGVFIGVLLAIAISLTDRPFGVTYGHIEYGVVFAYGPGNKEAHGRG